MQLARLTGIASAGVLALALAAPAMAASPQPLTAVVTANDGGTPTAGKVWVRVLHGSPDAPEVDVFVGATLAAAAKVDALSGLSFGEISDYVEVDPGTVAVKVCATADNSVCPITVDALELKADTKYTIAASDKLAKIKANVFVDAPADNADKAQARVVHLSADTPAVDVVTQDGKTKVVSDLAYPDATDYLALDAGSYDLKVCAAGTSTCPLDPGALDLAAGKAYSVFAVGSLAATVGDSKPQPPTDTLSTTPTVDQNGIAILALAVVGLAAFGLALRFAPVRVRK